LPKIAFFGNLINRARAAKKRKKRLLANVRGKFGEYNIREPSGIPLKPGLREHVQAGFLQILRPLKHPFMGEKTTTTTESKQRRNSRPL
jgi:hypothetical protein